MSTFIWEGIECSTLEKETKLCHSKGLFIMYYVIGYSFNRDRTADFRTQGSVHTIAKSKSVGSFRNILFRLEMYRNVFLHLHFALFFFDRKVSHGLLKHITDCFQAEGEK